MCRIIQLLRYRISYRMYFYLDTPNKNLSAIKIRYYVKSEKKRLVYSTGISINPLNWNNISRMPKTKSGAAGFELKQITNKLNRYIEELHISVNNIELEKRTVTREELKSRLNLRFKHKALKVENSSSFIYLYDDFVNGKIKQSKFKKNTIAQYVILKDQIDQFILLNSQYTNIESFDKDFLLDLILFLRANYNLSDKTLHRRIRRLKTFLKWVKLRGFEVQDNYKEITVKDREADHVYLSKEKVQILHDLNLNKRLDKYRDLFLIGCYSGQRFSDYTIFKMSDVVGNMIIKRAEKTDIKFYIPITEKLKQLLDKWDWRLPKISNQKFNDGIKEVCKIAGFNEPVTKTIFYGNKKIEEIKPFYERVSSHTARRSFITIAANQGVPDHLIMKITSIKDPKTLQTYKKFEESELQKWANNIF